MAARSGQKIKIICILEILRHYSDEEHPLNAAEICALLQKREVTAERKAIYDDIEVLIDYGFDIVKASFPKKGYFLASREFELPEIYLLADAVRSANFITPKKTRELISKLDSMLSENQAREREKEIYINSAAKCSNEEIYYSIDAVSRAITSKKKITFTYCVRRLSPEREIVTETKQMTVSPYALTWQDDHYYMIGNYEKYDNLMHTRVDRMRGVEITENNARPFSEVSEYKDRFDTADYTRKLFSMHGGETESIELCCTKRIVEQVVDRFSDKIFIKKVTDDHFCFSSKAAVSPALVTWILNYGSDIEVISPQKLREMVCERAEKVLKMYRQKT